MIRQDGRTAYCTAESSRPWIKAVPLCGTASGGPRAGLSPGEGRPARPRRPEAGGGTTDLEDLTATRRRAWPSSSLPIVRLAVTASRAALRAVAGDRLDVPSLDPATAHLGLAPTRKAGADQTWPVLIRKRSTPGVRRAWAGRKNDQPLAQMPAQLVTRVQTQCTGQR